MAGELEALMTRYCDGDAGAFRTLYARAAPALRAFLVRLTGDRATADDMLQATFLKVHAARGAYVRGADPMPWLYAIAHRTTLDELRRRKRSRKRFSSNDDENPVEEPAALSGKRLAEDDADAGDPEIASAAIAALATLPENQRTALVLTKLEGRSIAEAAEITGSTSGAIKLRAHRAYVALRARLGNTRAEARGESPHGVATRPGGRSP